MLAFFLSSGELPMKATRGQVRIMWYNVENLFHPENDSIPGDDEFTPEGVRHWTFTRYRKKLTSIAKLIVAAGCWEPPELVGLCEVENSQVLKELVQHPILAPYHYNYVHSNSPDRRGMDVACLYREKRIRLIHWEAFASMVSAGTEGTRDMLHVCGSWGKRDTLDLFLVHLISKYSGAGFTAEPRKQQVDQLLQLADSVQGVRENSLILLAGDFNEELGGYSMDPVRNARPGVVPVKSIQPESMGSYKYRGRWSRIDHYLVCGDAEKYRLEGSIMELPLLLIRDDTYGGIKPYRTYSGYSYAGGISDHLPILLDISGRLFSTPAER